MVKKRLLSEKGEVKSEKGKIDPLSINTFLTLFVIQEESLMLNKTQEIPPE
jgi:hypothetical protein